MRKKKNNYLIWVIIGVVSLIFIGFFINNRQNSHLTEDKSYLNDFAKCLNTSGAVFYGTFWCPHCQDQKDAFGSAFEYVDYVECSTSDGQGQLPACQQNNIESYPTWVFADGSREYGSLPLEVLSEKTNCALPPA